MADKPKDIAQAWLSMFASAVIAGDVEAITKTFLPHGWLRDLLTFTWDIRSLEGQAKIASYLDGTLSQTKLENVRLDDSFPLPPAFFPTPQSPIEGVEAAFVFETPIAFGKGYFRLLKDYNDSWKALTVFMMLSDLKGHEEVDCICETDASPIPWSDIFAKRKAEIESNPHVLIIGGGQSGLQIGARFKQRNIPTLIIERNERLGDSWRKRYPTLTLHTIRKHHELLYEPYPSNWPMFTPRDKLADWIEQYARTQDLVVWTSSNIFPKPTYDPAQKRWNVVVDHDGTPVEIHPAHIILATGALGAPRIPELLDPEKFKGEAFHASRYAGGHLYAGKRVIVVGACNTAIDVCQDLVIRKAASVTMVQRSSTCVVSKSNVARKLAASWHNDRPPDVGDFTFASMPLGLLKKTFQSQQEQMWAEEAELHEKLKKGGLKLNMGPEGEGQLLLVHERLGGYWLDKGAADLIASGEIKIKNGAEPIRHTETGVVFSDGSELPADVVVFATGYHNIRETNRELFGADIIDQTGEATGLNEEGESRGGYRPSGHPGLWYVTGDFAVNRIMSIPLAIQIKALELGLIPSA
ncbi:FAD/NAD-P-binding domain-containing protein [Obba rivulosa]|uniref:FAD/NAD-P-binding domain-containing protein n=1 Tax=Obba rivulosa TaxID=1052685 RepID=A0A8E2B304_9APHY|nr:FAD/NAD-P-binding domain-containing protein [Obba rivulosa]